MQTPYILIADDDSDDIEFITELLQIERPGIQLIHFTNGEEVLNFLHSSTKTNLPNLVVLDLNMPKMCGKRTIMAIRKDQQLKALPLVVYSSSKEKEDAGFCDQYSIQMINKPWDIQDLKMVAKRIASLCTA
jgi:CheY-like chemotaxis protein